MKNNTKLGIALAILGILTGLITFYLLAAQYNLLIDVKTAAGRIDEATSVRITYAVLGWFGIAAGAIWAAVLYGFVHKEKWAWFWGAIAATIQLLAGFFPCHPSHGQPTAGAHPDHFRAGCGIVVCHAAHRRR